MKDDDLRRSLKASKSRAVAAYPHLVKHRPVKHRPVKHRLIKHSQLDPEGRTYLTYPRQNIGAISERQALRVSSKLAATRNKGRD